MRGLEPRKQRPKRCVLPLHHTLLLCKITVLYQPELHKENYLLRLFSIHCRDYNPATFVKPSKCHIPTTTQSDWISMLDAHHVVFTRNHSQSKVRWSCFQVFILDKLIQVFTVQNILVKAMTKAEFEAITSMCSYEDWFHVQSTIVPIRQCCLISKLSLDFQVTVSWDYVSPSRSHASPAHKEPPSAKQEQDSFPISTSFIVKSILLND